MKIIQFAKTAAVATAVFGLLVPSIAVGANPGTMTQAVADVALAPGGLLQGRLVDTSGVPISAKSVAVVYDGQVVAKSTSDADGNFRISGLRGGPHVVATTGTSSLCRLWAGNAAPPQALTSVQIVEPRLAVRGQGSDYYEGPACDTCGPAPCGRVARFLNARTLLIGAAIGGIIWAASDDDNRRDDLPPEPG